MNTLRVISSDRLQQPVLLFQEEESRKKVKERKLGGGPQPLGEEFDVESAV